MVRARADEDQRPSRRFSRDRALTNDLSKVSHKRHERQTSGGGQAWHGPDNAQRPGNDALVVGLRELGVDLTRGQVDKFRRMTGDDVLQSILTISTRTNTAAPAARPHPRKGSVRNPSRNSSKAVAHLLAVDADADTRVEASESESRRRQGPRGAARHTDSGPVRYLLEEEGQTRPRTRTRAKSASKTSGGDLDALLECKSPRKRTNEASATALYAGRKARSLLKNGNELDPSILSRAESRVVHNVKERLLRQFGTDVSRLRDMLEAADAGNSNKLANDQFRRVLQNDAGVALTCKDFDVLARYYGRSGSGSDSGSGSGSGSGRAHASGEARGGSCGVTSLGLGRNLSLDIGGKDSGEGECVRFGYDRFVRDLSRCAKHLLPDGAVRQVDGARRRSLALQRTVGSALVRLAGGERDGAFGACKDAKGRVSCSSIARAMKDKVGAPLAAQDQRILATALKKAGASLSDVGEAAFREVLVAEQTPMKAHQLWTDDGELRARHCARAVSKERLLLRRVRDFVEQKRSWGAGTRDVFLALDKSHAGRTRMRLDDVVLGLGRLGLDLRGDEPAVLAALLAAPDAKPESDPNSEIDGRPVSPSSPSCTYDSFAKAVTRAGEASSDNPRAPTRVHHFNQRQHSARVRRGAVPCAVADVLAATRAKWRTRQEAYLHLKNGAATGRLSVSALHARLQRASGFELQRAEFNALVRSARVPLACGDVSFDQFQRILAADGGLGLPEGVGEEVATDMRFRAEAREVVDRGRRRSSVATCASVGVVEDSANSKKSGVEIGRAEELEEKADEPLVRAKVLRLCAGPPPPPTPSPTPLCL